MIWCGQIDLLHVYLLMMQLNWWKVKSGFIDEAPFVFRFAAYSWRAVVLCVCSHKCAFVSKLPCTLCFIRANSRLSMPKLNNCNRPNSGKLITDLPLFFYLKADSQAINDISLSRTVGTELVPNAWHSFEISRVFTVRLNLFPQIIYHIRNARMTAIAFHAPNSFKNMRLRKYPVRTGSKKNKRTILKTGKAHISPVPQYPALMLQYF